MYAAGTITAAIYNVHRSEGAKVLSGVDFVPDYEGKKVEEPQTEEEMIASMAAFFGAGPGKPN